MRIYGILLLWIGTMGIPLTREYNIHVYDTHVWFIHYVYYTYLKYTYRSIFNRFIRHFCAWAQYQRKNHKNTHTVLYHNKTQFASNNPNYSFWVPNNVYTNVSARELPITSSYGLPCKAIIIPLYNGTSGIGHSGWNGSSKYIGIHSTLWIYHFLFSG